MNEQRRVVHLVNFLFDTVKRKGDVALPLRLIHGAEEKKTIMDLTKSMIKDEERKIQSLEQEIENAKANVKAYQIALGHVALSV